MALSYSADEKYVSFDYLLRTNNNILLYLLK